MTVAWLDLWVWPALALAFFVGVKCAAWWLRRTEFRQPNKVNQQYFKGLNFLLNEQPDKAIEVFIQALEVDSETVELHLALGGLFRRKGQVDRATRIHQNLIARPSLTEEQRLHAICELAQDYYKAGLLDRAENLYLELKETAPYRLQAIEGLCSIYQQEKEWQKAIDVMQLFKRAERNKYAHRISHYWCELAQLAIDQQDYTEAKKCLRSAVNEDRSSVRAVLLRGQVCFQQGDYQRSIDLWQSVASSRPATVELTIVDMIECYQRLDNIPGLEQYLSEMQSIPAGNKAFEMWQTALFNVYGLDEAASQVLSYVEAKGLTGPMANYLFDAINQSNIAVEQQKELLKNLLSRAKNNSIEYTCVGCGFEAKAMHWHCPNCDEWDSFS